MAMHDDTDKTPRFMILASTGVVLAALYFAKEILIPIALAILLSFLLAPLVRRLERLRLPRSAAVVITVLLAFSVLFGIGYVVFNQIGDLKSDLVTFKENIHRKIAGLRGPLAWMHTADTEMKQAMAPSTEPSLSSQTSQPVPVRVVDSDASNSQNSPIDLVRSVGSFVLGPIGTAVIVTVFTIFMLLQREDLRDRLIRLVGRNRLTVATEALDDAAARVSRYLLMQSITNGSVGIAILISLWTIGKINGMPFPAMALWALLAVLLRFIPYVGIWVAAAMPILLSLAVYPHYSVVLEVLLAYGVIEAITGNIIEPLLFGASTGIATLAVLVAAAFWTWLWGPVGLLLSTPLTVCLVVMGKYVPQLEFLTILLGEEPALAPPQRVYQRLIALDQEEAVDLVNEYVKTMPLQELYDTVLVPVLAMAEQDLQRGSLDEARHKSIQDGMRSLIDELGDQSRAAEARADSQAVVDAARGDAPIPAAPVGSITRLPRGCTVNVACLPANGVSDELTAMMLGQLLEMRGYCVTIPTVAQLASEMVETVASTQAHVVCVSALPPAAITHARYLCKRLQARLPEVEMIVGLWATERDLNRAKERIEFVRPVQIAGQFSQAIDQIHQLAQPRIMIAGEERVA